MRKETIVNAASRRLVAVGEGRRDARFSAALTPSAACEIMTAPCNCNRFPIPESKGFPSMTDDPCPCGSGQTYAACCGPYLAGKRPAPTAEALMRSRYTAYVRNDAAYLEKTLVPRKRALFSARQTLDWNADVVWTGLCVLRARGGEQDSEGEVEFRASFVKAGEPGEVHEASRFRKKAGHWLYVDGRFGDAAETEAGSGSGTVAAAPKVGRNDPCPCGSGKKYKRCCG
jgi:SEC-C motif-containing protein